jgi:general secretion pathway protein M
LAPREQRAVVAAGWALGLALLWWLVGAPAWKTWHHAPAQHQRLDAQWQQVQTWAAQARALQAQPLLSRDDRLRALETSTQRLLGAQARLQVRGDQASVTLQRAPAHDVAAWLAEVRVNARITPVETRLTRDTAPAAPAAPPGSTTASDASSPPAPSSTWSGTVLLPL